MLQAAAEKSISLLPSKSARRVNALFQRYVTKHTKMDDTYFKERTKTAYEHLQAYKTQHQGSFPRNSLEFGVDKHLIVPISLFLMGVETTYLVDIAMLSTKRHLHQTFNKFRAAYEDGSLQKQLSISLERWEAFLGIQEELNNRSLQETLNALGLKYLIQDARALPFPNAAIDLIHSRHVFEHLSPKNLQAVLCEFKRIVSSGSGLFSHHIDLSDHFARFDSNISIYNFLRFSEQRWRYINSRIHPQNRWRIDDYHKLYEHLNIPIQTEYKQLGDLAAVQKLKLADRFAEKSLQTLAVSHCHLISRLD